MTKDQILGAMKRILREVSGRLSLDRMQDLSMSEIDDIFSSYLKEIDRIVRLGRNLFDTGQLERIYRSAYDSGASLLRAGGVSVSPLPTETLPVGYALARKEFDRAITQMGRMARFNALERKTMTKETLKTIRYGEKLQEQLLRGKPAGTTLSRSEREDLANKVARRFKPVTGVEKFRWEYYNISQSQGARLYKGKWDQISGDMTNVLKRSYRNGYGYEKTIGLLQKRLGIEFPEGKFMIPIQGPDGQIRYRNLDLQYYSELKLKWYETTMDSKGTIDLMTATGLDLVRYTLTGGNHSEICLELEAGGPVYSLSGKSDNYSELPIYPPAHYNCKSKLVPLPARDQERITYTDSDTEQIRERTEETPQTKRNIANEDVL